MTTAGRRGIVAVAVSVLLIAVGAGLAIAFGQAIRAHAPATDAATAITPGDQVIAWLARGLLALAAAWVLIGILAARTSLVARPGAVAPRATWLAATRPWRARESTLGMLQLDRWLLFGIPVALLVATRALQTSFVGWLRLLVVIGAWAVFALVLRIVVRRRSPWPVIAAVGGVIVLRCVFTLAALAIAGPGGYWYAFWALPAVRGLYVAVAFALFLWLFVAGGWALIAQLGARRAVGAMLSAIGAGVAAPAVVVAVVGIERTLAVWDGRTGLLPWGLAQILGTALELRVPDEIVWWTAGAGFVVLLTGAALATRWEAVRRPAVGSRA